MKLIKKANEVAAVIAGVVFNCLKNREQIKKKKDADDHIKKMKCIEVGGREA